MASNEITVSVKDTEVFAELLTASFEFFAWYNKTYQQQPSNHPEHPYSKLGQVLADLQDRAIAEPSS